jgi:hypothetical protein
MTLRINRGSPRNSEVDMYSVVQKIHSYFFSNDLAQWACLPVSGQNLVRKSAYSYCGKNVLPVHNPKYDMLRHTLSDPAVSIHANLHRRSSELAANLPRAVGYITSLKYRERHFPKVCHCPVSPVLPRPVR